MSEQDESHDNIEIDIKDHLNNNSNHYNDDDDGDHSKRSCKRKLGCAICTLLLLLPTALLTWRLGPWTQTKTYDATSLSASTSCENCCNGLESNCDMPVNRVLFPMVHDAHSSYENGFVAASNNLPLEEALVRGYRGLMLDSCVCEGFLGGMLLNNDEYLNNNNDNNDGDGGEGVGNLGFCSKYCSSGVRGALEVLDNIRVFLETNPNEVLVIKLQITDNSFPSLRQALNITNLLPHIHRFTDTYIQTWPTLQQLIDANTRLLVFAQGDDIKSCKANECPDGILYSLDHFSQTDEKDVESCDPTLSGDVVAGYFLMTHWKNNEVKLPSEKNAMELNSMESLKGRFEKCENRRRGPSILAVDFWDVGDVLDFVEVENLKRGGVVAVKEEEEEDGDGVVDGDDLSNVVNSTLAEGDDETMDEEDDAASDNNESD